VVGTSSSCDIEILAADGQTWVPVMLQQTVDDKGVPQDRSLTEALAASDNDLPLSDVLEPDVQESWFRGVGLDYDWAPGVDTTDPDYACPAGAATDVTLPGADSATIVAIEEFNGNLYMAQEGLAAGTGFGRVLEIVGGTGAPTASITLTAGEYMRGMVAAQDMNGNVRLYAFSSDGGVQHGRVHQFDGTIWTSSPLFPAAGSFGTRGKSRATTVYWRGRDGIGAQRIVSISGPRTISYTKPNTDPLLPASWVEDIKVGTASELNDVTAARSHVWFSARDGVFDIDEVGNTPNLAGFAAQSALSQVGGQAVLYSDGSVFWSWSAGLTKINVEQDGVLQEQPGFCAPGAYLPVEGCPRGGVVAMCVDQGWVVAAVFDGQSRWSAIFYGKSRGQLGIESPNPMIWHGPLLLLTGNYRVTRMRPSMLSGGLRLWVASVNDTTGVARLSWLSRPYAGTTLQDQYTGGTHRVTTGNAGGDLQPYSRLYLLPKSYGDKASRKDLHQIIVGSRGFDPLKQAQATVYSRADPVPGSTTWGAGTAVPTGPTYTIAAPSITEGQTLQLRIDFLATLGGSTPPSIPYLDSLRSTYWRTSPSTEAVTMTIAYGDGVTNREVGYDDRHSPDEITALLQAVMGRRTQIRDPLDRRRYVRLRQFFQRSVTLPFFQGGYGKTVLAVIRYDDLGAV